MTRRPYNSMQLTLSPILPQQYAEIASALHRALDAFNVMHGTRLVFDELTADQREEVLRMGLELEAAGHPCRKVSDGDPNPPKA